MKVLCLHSLDELEPLRDQINALNLASSSPDPFSTFEYCRNLLRFGPLARSTTDRLWFLAALRGARLLGFMALKASVSSHFGLRECKLEFLAGHDGDRPHVVAAPEHLLEVTSVFFAYLNGRPEWDMLELQQQGADSALYPPPAETPLHRCRIAEWPNMDNHSIDIVWRDLPEYFQSLTKKFRGELRRGTRRLFDAGDVQWLASSNPAATPALFELFCEIERRSWKSNAAFGISDHEWREEWMRGLLDPEQPMRIHIQLLLMDDVPIAGLICGEFNADRRNLYALQIAFDARFSALSPGSAMLLMGVRHAIVGRFASFNLLSGFGYYKHRWLARAVPTRAAQIYRIGRIPYWRRVLGDFRRAIARTRDAGNDLPFNRAKRERDSDEKPVTARLPSIDFAERAAFAARLEKLRRGNCLRLSKGELAALLPFPVTTQPVATQQEGSTATAVRGDGPMSRSESMTMPVALVSSPNRTPTGAPTTPQCVIPT